MMQKSANSYHSHEGSIKMSKKKKRILTIIILFFILIVPAITAVAAFYWVGEYYRDDDRIYPNISIEGVDVSWMTREEAIDALDLSELEQRISNAEVTLTFPDSSEFTIKGEDINLRHDAKQTVESVYSIGRGQGFVKDTISFLRRLYDNNINYSINHEYDLDLFHSQITGFVEDYNENLIAQKPLIYTDRIVITKGAGKALADTLVIKDIAYIGLFDSFESNHPVEINYSLPETTTDAFELLFLHQNMYVPVRSAELNLETLTVEECAVGVGFDLLDAVALLNDTESGKTATIYVDYTQPEITKDYLESLLFRDLLGTETTRVGGTADRVTNVRLSAEAINGLVLSPGEEFSFNGVVGVRTRERGYRTGGAFVGGELVPVTGGGICQTSSTLYSAIKDTELLVTERYAHGQPIPYLPRERDATVY